MKLIHVIWFLLTVYISSSWTSKKPDNASPKENRKSHSCNVQGPFMNKDYWETHCFLFFQVWPAGQLLFLRCIQEPQKMQGGKRWWSIWSEDDSSLLKSLHKEQKRCLSRQINEHWKDLNNTETCRVSTSRAQQFLFGWTVNVAAPWMKFIFRDFL